MWGCEHTTHTRTNADNDNTNNKRSKRTRQLHARRERLADRVAELLAGDVAQQLQHERLAKRAVDERGAKVAVVLEEAAAVAHAQLLGGALALGVQRDGVDLCCLFVVCSERGGGSPARSFAAHIARLPRRRCRPPPSTLTPTIRIFLLRVPLPRQWHSWPSLLCCVCMRARNVSGGGDERAVLRCFKRDTNTKNNQNVPEGLAEGELDARFLVLDRQAVGDDGGGAARQASCLRGLRCGGGGG